MSEEMNCIVRNTVLKHDMDAFGLAAHPDRDGLFLRRPKYLPPARPSSPEIRQCLPRASGSAKAPDRESVGVVVGR